MADLESPNMRDVRYMPRDVRAVFDFLSPIYTPASWKGVPFFCESTADEFGRRQDIYEYPLSDRTALKDMGRRARRYKVEGYLIGPDQVERSQQMAQAAESGEPGTLEHPIFGSVQVSCITLSMTADYKKDKKRTKLSFEFVEDSPSMAPYRVGDSIGSLFDSGSAAAMVSRATAIWSPSGGDISVTNDISRALGNMIAPAIDEASFNAIDYLYRGSTSLPTPTYGHWYSPAGRALLPAEPASLRTQVTSYPTFPTAIDPIDYGVATIRRLHEDALERLRDFNGFVVNRTEQLASDSVQSLVVTTRLLVAREYAVAAAKRSYATVKDALDDLDFIMAVYDEEEAIATRRCDDVLVVAIRKARAEAATAILARNIRLPGITEFPTDGHWPSLVVAQKIYNDAKRHEQIEAYNPTMAPFFMGRSVVAPAG